MIALGLAQSASLDVADRFLVRVEEAAALLSTTAPWWRERNDIAAGVRAVRMRTYPYLLLYRLVGRDSVEVISIVHGRRNVQALFKKEWHQEGV